MAQQTVNLFAAQRVIIIAGSIGESDAVQLTNNAALGGQRLSVSASQAETLYRVDGPDTEAAPTRGNSIHSQDSRLSSSRVYLLTADFSLSPQVARHPSPPSPQLPGGLPPNPGLSRPRRHLTHLPHLPAGCLSPLTIHLPLLLLLPRCFLPN